jgi:hypothetical protein
MPLSESTRPSPPRLHWGWVLGLNLITRNLFGIVWLIVQANWVRKVRGKSTAFVLAIVHCCFFPALILIGFVGGMLGATENSSWLNVVDAIGVLGFLVLWFATVFTLRSELLESPINIPLSGAMTFFFGPLYFQYHLHDYELGDGGGPAPNRLVGLGLSQPNS